MALQPIQFTSPVGRLVGGDLYVPKTKDSKGEPLLDRNKNPRQDFYFAVAFAKAGEQHWAQTQWGQHVWAAGHQFQGTAGQNPKFSWKVTDGDSPAPDSAGKPFNERAGYPGHWVVHFSGSYPPKLFTLVGQSKPVDLEQPGAIQRGYFVQVQGSTKGNDNMQQPGVYVNHNMVCLIAYGPVMQSGPDVAAAGFGAVGALPAGASMAPPAGFNPPAPLPQQYAPPAAPQQYAPPMPPAQLPPPNGDFRQLPPLPGAMPLPPAPAAAPAGPQRVMQGAFAAATYEQARASGWTDDQLIAAGHMRLA